SNLHGFLYTYNGNYTTNANYTTLDAPGGFDTQALGINDSDQVVGSYIDANSVQHGFLYSGATYTTLDDPNAVNGTVAQAINNAGDIVDYSVDHNPVHHGFQSIDRT